MSLDSPSPEPSPQHRNMQGNAQRSSPLICRAVPYASDAYGIPEMAQCSSLRYPIPGQGSTDMSRYTPVSHRDLFWYNVSRRNDAQVDWQEFYMWDGHQFARRLFRYKRHDSRKSLRRSGRVTLQSCYRKRNELIEERQTWICEAVRFKRHQPRPDRERLGNQRFFYHPVNTRSRQGYILYYIRATGKSKLGYYFDDTQHFSSNDSTTSSVLAGEVNRVGLARPRTDFRSTIRSLIDTFKRTAQDHMDMRGPISSQEAMVDVVLKTAARWEEHEVLRDRVAGQFGPRASDGRSSSATSSSSSSSSSSDGQDRPRTNTRRTSNDGENDNRRTEHYTSGSRRDRHNDGRRTETRTRTGIVDWPPRERTVGDQNARTRNTAYEDTPRYRSSQRHPRHSGSSSSSSTSDGIAAV